MLNSKCVTNCGLDVTRGRQILLWKLPNCFKESGDNCNEMATAGPAGRLLTAGQSSLKVNDISRQRDDVRRVL